MSGITRQAAALLGALLLALRAAVGAPAYQALAPMVSVRAENIPAAVRVFADGLTGGGFDTSREQCEKRLANFLLLPSFDGADRTRPIHAFLLSSTPLDALPDIALALPLAQGGDEAFLRALRTRYASVEGTRIHICSDPLEENAPEPLCVAIAEGMALVSSNLDAVRWLAYRLQTRTLPEPPAFRSAPLLATCDAPLLGRLLVLVAALDGDGTVAENGPTRHLRALGDLLGAFAHVDLALNASLMQWDAALRLAGEPGGPFATAFAAAKPPAESWMNLFPPFARKRALSSLPAFVAALPAGTRQWLADLADDSRLFGYGLLPAAANLDAQLRPLLAGTGLATYVSDKPNRRYGAIAVSELRDPAAATARLDAYFATNGPAARNGRLANATILSRAGRRVYAYSLTGEAASASGLGRTGDAFAQLLRFDHVEAAVAGGRLIVARGTPDVILPWLTGGPTALWTESQSVLTGALDSLPKTETALGGGAVEPVALVRQLVESLPGLDALAAQIPHPGGGFIWRLARDGGGAAVFDLRAYSNESLACDRLRGIKSSAMQEFLAQLVLRRMDDAPKDEATLRERLRELRAK